MVYSVMTDSAYPNGTTYVGLGVGEERTRDSLAFGGAGQHREDAVPAPVVDLEALARRAEVLVERGLLASGEVPGEAERVPVGLPLFLRRVQRFAALVPADTSGEVLDLPHARPPAIRASEEKVRAALRRRGANDLWVVEPDEPAAHRLERPLGLPEKVVRV